MKRKKIYENNKLPNALAGVTSSILTSLVYDELTSNIYRVQISEKGTYVLPEDKYNVLLKLGMMFLVFLFTWWFLSYLIPLGKDLVERNKRRNIPKYRRKDVIDIYRKSKNELIELIIRIDEFEKRKGDISFYVSDLYFIVHNLYKVFCPQKESLEAVVKYSFKDNNIINFENSISRYEYDILIECLYNISNKISENFEGKKHKEIVKKDIKKIEEMITKLKNI